MADLSSFGQAFATARAQGLPLFEWNGQQYTTELAEEVNQPAPSGSQQAMQQTPAGQVLGAGGPQEPGLLSQIQSALPSLLSFNEDESAQNIPAFEGVREAFRGADQKAKGLSPIERDVERHKSGARNASLDEGFFATLLASQGHELNTAQAISGRVIQQSPFDKISPTGQPLSPGRYAAESMQDSLNNLFGQAEAILINLGLGSRENPPDVGSVSIDRPDTRTAAVGSFVESGVNKLADLVGFLQTKLEEARSNLNAESQIATTSGSGKEGTV
jgi:hypothetical protein